MLDKTPGVAFIMNCLDARESLSNLLDGDLGLTERIPLEQHVNTCAECRQKLADLQIARALEEKPAPRPVHDWWASLAHRRPPISQWWPTLAHWRPTRNHWRPALGHWRPTFGRWRPTVSTSLIGRARGVIRPDHAAYRLRRFVAERFERISPKHLAAAAAVALVIAVAIFAFERGFTVGTSSMRQRPSSAPLVMRNNPPPAAPTDSAIPALPPPAPALPPPSTPPQAPSAPAQSPPSNVAPVPKVTETKEVEQPVIVRAPQTQNSVKQVRPESNASSKPAPVKAAPGQSAETARKGSLPAAHPTVPAKANSVGAQVAAGASARVRGTVDVVGRLQVKNRSEAERDLAALLSRAGGKSVSRQRGPSVTVVEAAVPHASYGKFSQGLVRLGSWRLEAERSPLPDLVHVSVRLAD
jgi:Putative zinc-finger